MRAPVWLAVPERGRKPEPCGSAVLGRDGNEPAARGHPLQHGFCCQIRHGSCREPGLAAPPFAASASRLRLRSDHGGIDGQPFHIRIGSHRFEYPVEDALIDPAVITSFDRLIRTEAIFGQVAPTRTGAGQPQDRIEEPPPVAAWPRLPLRPPSTNGFNRSH